MATTTVVDQYNLELERLSEHDGTPYPIRAMATNTANPLRNAETWWSLEGTRTNLLAVLGEAPDAVDWYLQQLEDHHNVQLASGVPGAKTGRAIFNLDELVRLGFNSDDLEM